MDKRRQVERQPAEERDKLRWIQVKQITKRLHGEKQSSQVKKNKKKEITQKKSEMLVYELHDYPKNHVQKDRHELRTSGHMARVMWNGSGGSGEGKRFLSLPTAVGLRQQLNFISQGPLNLSEMLDLQVKFYQCQDYKQTLNLPRENCLYWLLNNNLSYDI